ncbi:PREDICTED: uncharacterized protein LOC106748665 [Dinoponera quadriceps]|uniref:Uncharacterized protein LOC106748665 n=1 Tax=Dinoponera quadriceps TaxID=609295 RepID=A0A6P3XWI1_DINQU|nr:PREDICTED: uncharacterized protein LOC106748665 [Dinoponera quadriceps]
MIYPSGARNVCVSLVGSSDATRRIEPYYVSGLRENVLRVCEYIQYSSGLAHEESHPIAMYLSRTVFGGITLCLRHTWGSKMMQFCVQSYCVRSVRGYVLSTRVHNRRDITALDTMYLSREARKWCNLLC